MDALEPRLPIQLQIPCRRCYQAVRISNSFLPTEWRLGGVENCRGTLLVDDLGPDVRKNPKAGEWRLEDEGKAQQSIRRILQLTQPNE